MYIKYWKYNLHVVSICIYCIAIDTINYNLNLDNYCHTEILVKKYKVCLIILKHLNHFESLCDEISTFLLYFVTSAYGMSRILYKCRIYWCVNRIATVFVTWIDEICVWKIYLRFYIKRRNAMSNGVIIMIN
jgi:hypothetical protein